MSINVSDGYVNFFILGMDSGGKLIAFNKRCEELTGYRREEVLHKKIWNTIFPKDIQSKWEEIFSNRSNRLEIPILTKDGKIIDLVWSPMQVGITNKELWLIGAEKSKEDELWKLLDMEKDDGGINPNTNNGAKKQNEIKESKTEREQDISQRGARVLMDSIKYMEEAVNLLEKQWTRLKEYADCLEKIRNVLEKYAENIEKERRKLDKYREKLEKRIKKSLSFVKRDLKEREKEILRISKWNNLMEKIDDKLREIEKMRERLSEILEKTLERNENIENLKRQVRNLQRELEEYRKREGKLREEMERYRQRASEVDVKSKLFDEIKRKEKEIMYKETDLEKRERLLREKEERLKEKEKELMQLLTSLSRNEKTKESNQKLEKEVADLLSTDKPIAVLRRGIIQKVNSSLLDMLGYEEDELIDRSFFSLVDSEDLLNLQKYYLSKLKGNESQSGCEIKVINSKEERVPVRIKLDRIKQGENIISVVEMERISS